MEIYKFVFSPIDENTYVLADQSGDCAIIDCGCYDRKEFKVLQDFLNSKNLKPVLLLNTHCHLDHIFGNKFMLEAYNLRTHSDEREEGNRKNAAQHALLFGLTMEESPEPAGFISHNSMVKFGNTELKAFEVPGHTAGSLAFYSEKNGCVFTGDALFAGSIGRTDLPGGNFETLISKIKNNLFVLPPETVVYSGHGPETTIEREMRTNPYFT